MAGNRKKKTADAEVWAFVADMHAGSTTAIAPPDPIVLDDGQELAPSAAQKWVWGHWRDFWAEVADVRERESARLGTAYIGDLVDGPHHHNTLQSASLHPGVELDIARACMEVPQALRPDWRIVVRGTEAHAGKSGKSEEALARWLEAERHPDTGTHSWWEWRPTIQGLRLDVSHHGRGGFLPHTAAAAAVRYAYQVFNEYAENGETPPHIAIRGHLHMKRDTGDLAPVRLLQLPCWQLKTAFGYRLAAGSIADIGGLILVIRNGEYDVRWFKRRPERGNAWRAA